MPSQILSSLVAQISNYAKRINSEAGFIDKSWTYIDNKEQIVKLLFKSNNRLLINQQGRVTEGAWEFIPQWKGLIVEIDQEKTLYNQAMVFDDTIMVLKVDGTEDYLPLCDDNKVTPDGIIRFLENYSNAKQMGVGSSPVKQRTYKLDSGQEIVLKNEGEVFYAIGSQIVAGEYPSDYSGELTLMDGYVVIFEEGKVVSFDAKFDDLFKAMAWGAAIVIVFIIALDIFAF